MNKNKRELTKENYLKNGSKHDATISKNKINTTIEEPGINESGIEAKRKGWQ
jgi:hypothetical protein